LTILLRACCPGFALDKVLDEICQTAVESYADDVPMVADLQQIVNSNAELKLEWNIAQGLPSDLAFAIIEMMHKCALNKGALFA
jgi:hypothetical protein